ncbi:MAG TPA: hypothetical protein VJT15_13730 [Pyrinomonadaceae bacterium]|nr:hypothetical protein [Pyrinomonadaceae bacterium]
MPSSRFTKSALVVLAILVCMVTGLSQQPAPAQAEKKPAEQVDKKPAEKDPKAQTDKPGAKAPYTLKVKTRPILNISLKAEKANAADVAQELSKKINAPIFLGTERQKDPLSIEFSELTLEPALQLLSPTVYVDYEIDAGSPEPPKVLGIFLYDVNQGEPPLTAVVHGSTQSILIEGNTEDGVVTEGDDKEKKEEEPLKVTYENYALSVKAKKQSLSLIMLKIGETLGIPVDIQDERMEVVDANISKLPIEDALRQLAPNIKMFLRADLTRSERRALRLILTQPPRQTQ